MKNGNRIEVDLVLLGTVILVALRLDEVIRQPVQMRVFLKHQGTLGLQ